MTKYTINELANSKGVLPLVREALLQMEAELKATNRQVEILSDALAESRREVAPKDKALDLALEAFVRAERDGYWSRDTAIAVEAIKQARSAPVQQPVAVVKVLPLGDGQKPMRWADWTDADNPPPEGTLLYTAAQPATVQEPVGYVAENGVVDWNVCAPPILTDLYTTPPAAQRQWVGLTPHDIRQLEKENTVGGLHGDYCPTWDLIESVEAKLRSKNGY